MQQSPKSEMIVSYDSATRLSVADGWLDKYPLDTEILIISPTRESGDEFVRNTALKSDARFGLARITLDRLAVNLAAPILAESGRVPATSLSLEALTARCVHILISEGVLSYFGPVAKRPGFPRAVARTLDELRMNAVDIGSLRDLPRGGIDLAALAECVELELASAKLADRATIFEAALEAAQQSALSTRLCACLARCCCLIFRFSLFVRPISSKHSFNMRLRLLRPFPVETLARSRCWRTLLEYRQRTVTKIHSRFVQPPIRRFLPITEVSENQRHTSQRISALNQELH